VEEEGKDALEVGQEADAAEDEEDQAAQAGQARLIFAFVGGINPLK
jgi:hypothetical protein